MKSQFKRILRSPATVQQTVREEPKSEAEIYTDRSVCRVLKIRRRVLTSYRIDSTKGRDWDVKCEEAGMTRAWIDDYALQNGIVPDFFGENGLEAVSGKYVSVKMVGSTPNRNIVLVELESNRKREYCRVRNTSEHPIYYKEIFSAMRIHLDADKHLEWIAGPNEMKY